MSKLAVIQIRGTISVPYTVKDALFHLKLKKVNNCRIINDTPEFKGVLEKVKHLVTWGPVSDEVLILLKKKGEGPVYALTPPKKGYGRKGIKMPFNRGGAYGNRDEKINDLIKRML